mgnify:CR=1 FL=1
MNLCDHLSWQVDLYSSTTIRGDEARGSPHDPEKALRRSRIIPDER